MEHEHLAASDLERLLAVDRTEEQNRHLFHLLAVCPQCHETGGWLLDLRRSGALPLQFGPVDVALARSRTEAPLLWDELTRIRPEDQPAHVRSGRHFASWGLCELLCRKSRETAPGESMEAVRLAELAVQVADLIVEDEPIETRWVYQLRALAWACLTNAHRVCGDLKEAQRCLETSDFWWEAGLQGAEDAFGYEPVLLDLKASLRIAQRQLPEALSLLDHAIELFAEGDAEQKDLHLAGRALILKSGALIEMGQTESAIQALKKASGWIDPQRDPRLVLNVHHNLADTLSRAGHLAEAAALVPEARALAEAHGSRFDRVRVDWVDGRVAAGLGDRGRARRLLSDVRQAFLAENNAFDAALATLDLVVPCLEEGRTAEVRELAEEMVIAFEAQEVPREAMAALLVFHRAALLEKATAELAREVAGRLARVRGGGY
jgi:tetratricopeptide (TPR) repeat protein